MEEMWNNRDIAKTGYFSKADEMTREADKRLTAALEDIQEFPTSAGYVLHLSAIYWILQVRTKQ